MNTRIFKKAMKLLEKMPKQKYKLCAIITDKKGRILSKGFNSFEKTSPTQAYYAKKVGRRHQIFLHAELHALSKVPYTQEPYAIYVTRMNNKGEPMLAKPCRICSAAIKDSGIKEVYHT